jgi:hypothetical protein
VYRSNTRGHHVSVYRSNTRGHHVSVYRSNTRGHHVSVYRFPVPLPSHPSHSALPSSLTLSLPSSSLPVRPLCPPSLLPHPSTYPIFLPSYFPPFSPPFSLGDNSEQGKEGDSGLKLLELITKISAATDSRLLKLMQRR